jgi:tryptophan-rich sensory protein
MLILQAAMEPAMLQQMLLWQAMPQCQVATAALAGVMVAVQQLETAAAMVLMGTMQLQQQLGPMVRIARLQQGRTARVLMAVVMLVVTVTVLQRQRRQSYKRRPMMQQHMVLRPVMLPLLHCHRGISSKQQQQQQTMMHMKQKRMTMQMMRLLAMMMTMMMMITTLLTRSTCRRSGMACDHAARAHAG